MTVEVRFFASLKERMGRGEALVEAAQGLTVAEVWRRVGGGERGNLLAAVNMEYVDFEHAVADGDEVAFFPPVTGG